MKMFMDEAVFGDEEDEVVQEDDADTDTVEVRKEKKKMDPLAMMWRAISHPAYQMLTVYD